MRRLPVLMLAFVMLAFVMLSPLVATAQQPDVRPTARGDEAVATQAQPQATLDEIAKTFGFVPTFLKAYPPSALPGAWQYMKGVWLNPKSALSAKDKELIGLAVAAQIPCNYCIYSHTEGAKAHGATAAEINEAIALAANTRQWSTTLTGAETNPIAFRAWTDDALAHVKKVAEANPSGGPMPLARDADEARRQIVKVFGDVPPFIDHIPDAALAGAWNGYIALNSSTPTALPAKTRELIGVAVASQAPAENALYMSMRSARQNGATSAEIDEAVVMAATVRHWSTYLNGTQADMATFRREVDRMLMPAKRGT